MLLRINFKNLIIISIILIIGSLFYDIVFINIPFQDPSVEMVSKRNNQIPIKNIFLNTGFILLIFSGVMFILKKIRG